MANEIIFAHSAAGADLYAVILNSVGQIYNSDTPAFEAITDANWADYCFILIEAGTASQIYLATFPGLAAGVYTILVYEGGASAVGDPLVGAGKMDWDGSAEKTLSNVGLANDAITSAKFDEATAFPLVSADSGATAVARTGADGDTLETLSDQVDGTATAVNLATVDMVVDAIKAVTDLLPNGGALTDLAAILVDTGTDIPALIAALNNLSSGDVQAAAAAAIAAFDPPTHAELIGELNLVQVDIAALNNFDPNTELVQVGGLELAALTQFVTDDTGEVAAVSGSVADLSQGAGGSGGGATGSESVSTFKWTLDGVHEINFVLVDADGVEVAGLGDTFTIHLRKSGGAFALGAGTKAEIGNGWYSYTNTEAEADTVGPVAIRAVGAGTVQQNLLATVESLQINAVYYTYTVTNSVTLAPVPDVQVWVTTDLAGDNIIINNLTTDALGVARTPAGSLPLIDPGTYYFWKRKAGVSDDDSPDTEVVG